MPHYDYPRPALTADTLLFSTSASGERTLLLIRRGGEPFTGLWALPGGFVNEGETSRDAAMRELQEETGVAVSADALVPIGLYDAPGRDPRGWTISMAYALEMEGEPRAEGRDDAADARWWPTDRLPELAFDHAQIVADALATITHRKE